MTEPSQPSSTDWMSGRPPEACFVFQSVRAFPPVSMLVALIVMFGVVGFVLCVEPVEAHRPEGGDGQLDGLVAASAAGLLAARHDESKGGSAGNGYYRSAS